jgi:hypothetical protein
MEGELESFSNRRSIRKILPRAHRVTIDAVLFGIKPSPAMSEIKRGWSEIVEKGCLTRHFAAFQRFNAPPKA